jgi:hypothetical protein
MARIPYYGHGRYRFQWDIFITLFLQCTFLPYSYSWKCDNRHILHLKFNSACHLQCTLPASPIIFGRSVLLRGEGGRSDKKLYVSWKHKRDIYRGISHLRQPLSDNLHKRIRSGFPFSENCFIDLCFNVTVGNRVEKSVVEDSCLSNPVVRSVQYAYN